MVLLYLLIKLLDPLGKVGKCMKIETINDFLNIVQDILEHFEGIFTRLQVS